MIGVDKRFREERACKRCGYTRVVKVLVWVNDETGKREEVFAALCEACKIQQAIDRHQERVDELHLHYLEVRAKLRARQARREGKTQ
jgi:hypothetical protein